MQAAVTSSDRKAIPVPLITAALTVIAWAVHIGIREGTTLEPGAPIRLVATGVLVFTFAAHVVATIRLMRQFDEFTKTIHLTALAFAFPASMVLLFALGFFRAEGLLSELDPRDLSAVMLLMYAAGLAWAWRRY